jgi:hypothetical protein
MNLLSTNVEEIADVFIRPARHIYKMSDLGPCSLTYEGHKVMRKDFDVKNNRNLTLKCSLYSP